MAGWLAWKCHSKRHLLPASATDTCPAAAAAAAAAAGTTATPREVAENGGGGSEDNVVFPVRNTGALFGNYWFGRRH
jgi:hypothetical protein